MLLFYLRCGQAQLQAELRRKEEQERCGLTGVLTCSTRGYPVVPYGTSVIPSVTLKDIKA